MRYLTEVRLKREAIQHDWWPQYPFAIPTIRNLETLPLDENVTF